MTNPGTSETFDRLDKYSIKQCIGRGQFSEVYKAINTEDGKAVAIKKIHFAGMTDAFARQDCLKEINILKQLNHVNIIQYLSSFVIDSQLHIVLELAEAGDLSWLIQCFRRIKKSIHELSIWKYFVQICAAVNHMHSRRIMHRDIKPANVFVTNDGVVKLGDLGLGRYFSYKTVAAHSLVGTPYYMSPERIQKRGYSFKSDIWSLGCLLYELAALKSPFYEDKLSLHQLIGKIENCRYDPLPSHVYSIKMRNLVDICIKPEPSKRPDILYVYSVASDMHTKGMQMFKSSMIKKSFEQ